MYILDTEQVMRAFEEPQGCPGNAARIGTETLTRTGYPMPSRVKCSFSSSETTWLIPLSCLEHPGAGREGPRGNSKVVFTVVVLSLSAPTHWALP